MDAETRPWTALIVGIAAITLSTFVFPAKTMWGQFADDVFFVALGYALAKLDFVLKRPSPPPTG